MRIQDGYPKAIDTGTPSVTRPTHDSRGRLPASTTNAEQDGVTVTVSDRARELAAKSVERPIDVAKVERLRSQIEDGTFRVDPKAIAKKIVGQDET